MKDKPKSDLRQVVLLRHGESLWNRGNLFTGWTDVDLSDRGREEGREAGRCLKEHGVVFDVAFTSVLKRAIRTLWIVLDEMDLMWIPVHRDWRLNERHYGALQGLNKAGTAEKFGEPQVKLWRRSYDIRPPVLEAKDLRHLRHDARYRDLSRKEIPAGIPLVYELDEDLKPIRHYFLGDAERFQKAFFFVKGDNNKV